MVNKNIILKLFCNKIYNINYTLNNEKLYFKYNPFLKTFIIYHQIFSYEFVIFYKFYLLI